MKKALVAALSLGIFAWAGSAVAGPFELYESYEGKCWFGQYVGEGTTYNFGFDMWYDNGMYDVVTDAPKMKLTNDAAGGVAKAWQSASVMIDFWDYDFAYETAEIIITAWGFNGGEVHSEKISGNLNWLTGSTYQYKYDFDSSALTKFASEGWGNVSITASWDGDKKNYNDFYITKVALGANPVPEPATMLLFGAGLAGLAAVGRRRKAE